MPESTAPQAVPGCGAGQQTQGRSRMPPAICESTLIHLRGGRRRQVCCYLHTKKNPDPLEIGVPV